MKELLCQVHEKRVISVDKQTQSLLCSQCLQEKYVHIEEERCVSQEQFNQLCSVYQNQQTSLNTLLDKIQTNSSTTLQTQYKSPNIKSFINIHLSELIQKSNKILQTTINSSKLSPNDPARINLHHQIQKTKKAMKAEMIQQLKEKVHSYYSQQIFQ